MENKNKIRASVFILTKNSAATLRRALESVKDFEDLIICDGGSFDDTLAIAKRYGARIFRQAEECLESGKIRDYSCVRNQCMSHAVFDWMFYIDSDEFASLELIQEIRAVVRSSVLHYYAYRIPARIRLAEEPGREIGHSSSYPGYQIRFFNKKRGARFVKPVHERVDLHGDASAIGTFSGGWYYFVQRDGRDYEADFPIYIRLEGERYRVLSLGMRGKGVWSACLTAGKIFVKAVVQYVLYGFRDSIPPRIEYLRIKYQLLLAWHIIWNTSPK